MFGGAADGAFPRAPRRGLFCYDVSSSPTLPGPALAKGMTGFLICAADPIFDSPRFAEPLRDARSRPRLPILASAAVSPANSLPTRNPQGRLVARCLPCAAPSKKKLLAGPYLSAMKRYNTASRARQQTHRHLPASGYRQMPALLAVYFIDALGLIYLARADVVSVRLQFYCTCIPGWHRQLSRRRIGFHPCRQPLPAHRRRCAARRPCHWPLARRHCVASLVATPCSAVLCLDVFAHPYHWSFSRSSNATDRCVRSPSIPQTLYNSFPARHPH